MGCTRDDAIAWVMMQPALNKWSSGTSEARRYILFLCKQNSKTMVLWTVLLLLFSFSDRYEVRQASQVALVKNPPANAGGIRDAGSIPGSGRFTGGGHGNPIQYSCLENPHGQRSLAGYSRKKSDRTEATWHAHMKLARNDAFDNELYWPIDQFGEYVHINSFNSSDPWL